MAFGRKAASTVRDPIKPSRNVNIKEKFRTLGQ